MADTQRGQWRCRCPSLQAATLRPCGTDPGPWGSCRWGPQHLCISRLCHRQAGLLAPRGAQAEGPTESICCPGALSALYTGRRESPKARPRLVGGVDAPCSEGTRLRPARCPKSPRALSPGAPPQAQILQCRPLGVNEWPCPEPAPWVQLGSYHAWLCGPQAHRPPCPSWVREPLPGSSCHRPYGGPALRAPGSPFCRWPGCLHPTCLLSYTSGAPPLGAQGRCVGVSEAPVPGLGPE